MEEAGWRGEDLGTKPKMTHHESSLWFRPQCHVFEMQLLRFFIVVTEISGKKYGVYSSFTH